VLDVSLVQGFQPVFGDVFEVMTYASRQGQFSEINGIDLGEGLMFEPLYGQDSFALVVTPEPATLSLLALGGLAILRRRRRGMCK
jgi:hypothetical protein